MAHHSSDGLPPEFASLFDIKPKLGATGKFPLGKLTESDEGELLMGITHHKGKVIVDFGKPTSWIGFTPEQAEDIADMLRRHANAIRSEKPQ